LRPYLIISVVAGLAFSACSPTCEQTCTKLRSCGVGPDNYTQQECQSSCERQRELYVSWEDQEKEQAMDAHRTCIGNSTCDEILDGVCYSPEIFIFDTDVI